MPIEEDAGHFVLRCVNYHGPEYQSRIRAVRDPDNPDRAKDPPKTTMAPLNVWLIIPATTTGPGGDVYPDMQRGAPIRIYICQVCGYVEMYSRPLAPPMGPPSGELSGGRFG